MSEKYVRQMKKGVLDMLVLKLLSDQPKYGYQLISELEAESGGVFCLKEGTLYPILYRLEEDGLVKATWSEPEERQVPRKYYLITDEGRKMLLEIKHIWDDISKGVNRIMEQ